MSISARVTTGFADFLQGKNISLLLSSPSNGQLLSIGCDQSGFSYDSVPCPKPMGISNCGNDLVICVDRSLKWFKLAPFNAAAEDIEADGYFASNTYMALHSNYVGEVDCHEVHLSCSGLIFAATKFNCISTLDQSGYLSGLWHPSFIDRLVYEDRCHLNGLASDPSDKENFIVSCHGQKNKAKSWIDSDLAQGCLLHSKHGFLLRNNVVMPHSPRIWHEDIVFCNSGHGSLDLFDMKSLMHERVTKLPGFTRGLSILGNYAIVGYSKARERFFSKDLPVFHSVNGHADLKCGLAIVDLLSGQILHALEFISGIDELFDVQVMPGPAPVKIIGLSYESDTQVKNWADLIRF